MKNKIFFYVGLGLAAVSLNSCDLDINKDPYAVTNLDMAQLLTAVESDVAANFAEGYYLNSNFSAYTHHTVSREIDNYSLISSYSTLGNTWQQAYLNSIKGSESLISMNEGTNTIYASIGRILRAYTYMNMVDLWGDIPYSEANKNGIENPKCDKSEDIYNDIIAEVEKAVADLKDASAPNSIKPEGNDLYYGGDVEKWIKAANTLELRMLVNARKAKDQITDYTNKLNALIAEDNFIADGEDLQFPHSATKTPSDERKSGYVDEYEGGQKSVYISPWFYEIMKGYTTNYSANPLRGIEDPRIPYYFYNQSTATADATNKTDYRDGAFISIFFGSNTGLSSGTQEKSMTTLGIYPIGGLYDDGSAQKVGAGKGNGIAPDKMIQAYSVPFMKAELILAGLISGDAKAELEKGIKASITHVNTVAKASNASAPAISATAVTDLVNAVGTKFDAASAEVKMEILMTEKWIANFFNSVESYTDIRRTGYPVLVNENTTMAYSRYDHTVAATPLAVSAPAQIELVKILAYPRIMWYPNDETEVNPNISNKDRIVSDKTVFWDK